MGMIEEEYAKAESMILDPTLEEAGLLYENSVVVQMLTNDVTPQGRRRRHGQLQWGTYIRDLRPKYPKKKKQKPTGNADEMQM
jgi:hypothetical protein